jgi:hypothetical protein
LKLVVTKNQTPLNIPTYWSGYLHVELWRCRSCDCSTSDCNNVVLRCVYIPSGFLLDNGTSNADRKKYDRRPSEQLTTNKLTWVWLICSADVRIKIVDIIHPHSKLMQSSGLVSSDDGLRGPGKPQRRWMSTSAEEIVNSGPQRIRSFEGEISLFPIRSACSSLHFRKPS